MHSSSVLSFLPLSSCQYKRRLQQLHAPTYYVHCQLGMHAARELTQPNSWCYYLSYLFCELFFADLAIFLESGDGVDRGWCMWCISCAWQMSSLLGHCLAATQSVPMPMPMPMHIPTELHVLLVLYSSADVCWTTIKKRQIQLKECLSWRRYLIGCFLHLDLPSCPAGNSESKKVTCKK